MRLFATSEKSRIVKPSALVLTLAVTLSGCPAVIRIYVHNNSESILTYHSPLPAADPIVIRPGRTRYFGARPDADTCAEFDIGDRQAFFMIQRELYSYAKHKGYGGRLEVFYEYGRLFVHHGDAGWIRVAEVRSCDDA